MVNRAAALRFDGGPLRERLRSPSMRGPWTAHEQAGRAAGTDASVGARAEPARPVEIESGDALDLPRLDDARLRWAGEWAARLEHASIDAILTWALETFGDRLGCTTALGYSGLVMLDHLRRLAPDLEIHFIDTRQHFPETLALRDRLADEWGIRITTLETRFGEAELEDMLGPDPWRTNPDVCCTFRKVLPLLEILPRRDAWLGALRRDQSPTRSRIEVVEVDGRGTLKVQPLAGWTRERCWDYLRERGLPWNPLHDQHYPSVGCTHCTAPVRPGEHERAGRWNSMPKLECGLNLPSAPESATGGSESGASAGPDSSDPADIIRPAGTSGDGSPGMTPAGPRKDPA